MLADTSKVISRIKAIENKDWQSGEYIDRSETRYDMDVAKVIGMSAQNLANYRTRNTLPFKQLVKYGIENNININKLLSK